MLSLGTEDADSYELLVRGLILDGKGNTGIHCANDCNIGRQITGFTSPSPAAKAGCQIGDLIISVTFPVHSDF